MNWPHDEGSPADRIGNVLTLQREERPEVPEVPEVKSFSQPDAAGKPLVAFETLPVHRAAPLTWDSDNS
jgi:hypothetical protein